MTALPSRFSLAAMLRTPLRALCAGAAVLAASAASAQDLTHKAPPQTAPITLYNATIHTVSGPTIAKGFIVFDKGIIKEVGEGNPHIPANDPSFIDVQGKHIYPGMVASSTLLGLTEIVTVRPADDSREAADISPEVHAAVAVNPDSTLIPVARTNGILTAAVSPRGGRIPGRVSVMRMDGWTWEEMAVRADAGLAISWPQSRTFSFPGMENTDSEQAEVMRRGYAAVDDAFKAAAAYAAAHEADPTLPKDLRWEGMKGVLPKPSGAAGEQLPVFISAQDADQITAAVTWAIEKKLRPVIVGGRDSHLCTELLKRHDVPVIIVGILATPRRADSPYDDAYTLPARLAAAGVRFCIESDDEPAHQRNLPYHAAMAAVHGLDHEAAVKSVTLWPAQILGVGDTLGSLEAGKAATLMVTTGNILEITTNVERAYIDGRQIDLSNKQTKLADKYREKYRQQKGR